MFQNNYFEVGLFEDELATDEAVADVTWPLAVEARLELVLLLDTFDELLLLFEADELCCCKTADICLEAKLAVLACCDELLLILLLILLLMLLLVPLDDGTAGCLNFSDTVCPPEAVDIF